MGLVFQIQIRHSGI